MVYDLTEIDIRRSFDRPIDYPVQLREIGAHFRSTIYLQSTPSEGEAFDWIDTFYRADWDRLGAFGEKSSRSRMS